jgi:hypothetical protein
VYILQNRDPFSKRTIKKKGKSSAENSSELRLSVDVIVSFNYKNSLDGIG